MDTIRVKSYHKMKQSANVLVTFYCTDMSKKWKDRLRDPALQLKIRDHATYRLTFFEISVVCTTILPYTNSPKKMRSFSSRIQNFRAIVVRGAA